MIGKYFQNSIREDGLLAVARQGVVFSAGTAGTVQEIFQNAAQNFYRTFGHFSPMVFLGGEHWRTTCPVDALLQTLLEKDDYGKFVLVTDDINAAASFIEKFVPPNGAP
jgi:predicted Rossmann-fold nucleotide-binding protein